MDHFGIGAGIEGASRVYFQSSRSTGRTLSLVESLKNTDRVVFLSQREARRVQRLCMERGVDIEFVVCDVREAQGLMARGSGSGDARTIFDHSWVQAFYERAIQKAQDEIDFLERVLSGRGEAHRETARRALEISKWR